MNLLKKLLKAIKLLYERASAHYMISEALYRQEKGMTPSLLEKFKFRYDSLQYALSTLKRKNISVPSKKSILEKFKDKVLGQCDYGKQYPFTVEKFTDLDWIIYFFYEMSSYETSLTEEGVQFLEEYYGWDKIVEVIQEENAQNGNQIKYNEREDIIAWIKRKGHLSENMKTVPASEMQDFFNQYK